MLGVEVLVNKLPVGVVDASPSLTMYAPVSKRYVVQFMLRNVSSRRSVRFADGLGDGCLVALVLVWHLLHLVFLSDTLRIAIFISISALMSCNFTSLRPTSNPNSLPRLQVLRSYSVRMHYAGR